MGQLPEPTFNLILSALMGAISGFLTIPINAYIMWIMKRDEMQFQHKLDIIAKQRELYLQHKLEMQRKDIAKDKIEELENQIKKLEKKLNNE